MEAQVTRSTSDDEATSFSAQLRRYRKRAGLTQEALAEKAGLGVNTIGNLEREISQPYRETVKALASALELSPEERGALSAASRRRQGVPGEAASSPAPAGSFTPERISPRPPEAQASRSAKPAPMRPERLRRVGTRTIGIAAAVFLVIGLGVVVWLQQAEHVRRARSSAAPTIAVRPVEAGWPVLRRRSHGTAVVALQYLLNGYNPSFNLIVNGIFGRATAGAVQNFQQQNNVRRDSRGIVGAQTWQTLTE